MREIRSQKETEAALVNLIGQVKETYLDEQPLVVGIHTGGAWIASRICEQLHWDEPATLDISLYRDDFETSGLKRSGITDRMPKQLNGERILLVDDVLFTGRTIRAAINVLFDYGRAGRIDLGVLFDRGGRELPI
ncbi:MAG TPA: bifunctional pyr operon transcriptional regulator/uracil phosphoribosyltransferase PyrR, partial [Gammaproteobacteria bacterium]|nr:bifunctional pyr operon transcriptional regulator/uracil phosphoribosyltransferase PyrR [Gammaproteobacteria bacterium]